MKKKSIKKLVFTIIILFISIGFAVLTSNLSLNTKIAFRENTFDIHFENINVLDSSTLINPSASITDTTSIDFSGDFNKPGEYIDFSFYIVNSGTIDGQLNSITTNLTTEQLEYINYSFKYAIDDSLVNLKDYIYAGQSRKVIARFEYKEDIDSFIDLESLNLTLNMEFIQPKTVTTTVWNYEYSGTEQYFIVPKSGTYKIELWGASGGNVDEINIGGYGGYSAGNINLSRGNKYYINVGGQGEGRLLTEDNKIALGGYNGGGVGSSGFAGRKAGGGGGATHIASASGELYLLESNKSSVIMVAGGGAGSWYWKDSMYVIYSVVSGSGGGYIGSNGENTSGEIAYGGTQSYTTISSTENNLGEFGRGAPQFVAGNAGAGGGYYGGNSVPYAAAGGSGYIGNTNLTDKIMYCYNCQSSENEDDETHIKTRSTTNVSETPTSNYAKIGNGYARITFVK